jgi:hypothetical protein
MDDYQGIFAGLSDEELERVFGRPVRSKLKLPEPGTTIVVSTPHGPGGGYPRGWENQRFLDEYHEKWGFEYPRI